MKNFLCVSLLSTLVISGSFNISMAFEGAAFSPYATTSAYEKPTTTESDVYGDTQYTFRRGKVEDSDSKTAETTQGGTVNNSKTMYTDALGRLHFFDKGNLIKK